MTKRYHIISLSLTAILWWFMAGCSSDETKSSSAADRQGVDIILSTASVDGTATRAGIADTYNDALPAGSDIGVYIYGYDGSTSYDISVSPFTSDNSSKTWVYRTAGAAVSTADGKESNLNLTSHTKGPRFPLKDNNTSGDMDRVEIFAVYPNIAALKPDVTSTTYTVASDQTVEDNIKASELMTNDKVAYTKEQCERKSLQLVLRHRMAKLHVNFIPKAGSDLTAANMPTSFKVLGVRRSVTVNPKAGTVTTTESEATTAEHPLLGTTTQSFYIPQQTLAAGTTLLTFDIKGSGNFKGIAGCSFQLPSEVTFAAGCSYEINVTVDVDHITTTGTITTWTDGGKINYTEYTDSII